MSRLEHIILTSTPSAARTRRAPRPLRVRSSTRIAAWPLLRAHAALPPECCGVAGSSTCWPALVLRRTCPGNISPCSSPNGLAEEHVRLSSGLRAPFTHRHTCRSQVTAFQMSSCTLLTRASLASLASRLAVIKMTDIGCAYYGTTMWMARESDAVWHTREQPCTR